MGSSISICAGKRCLFVNHPYLISVTDKFTRKSFEGFFGFHVSFINTDTDTSPPAIHISRVAAEYGVLARAHGNGK